MYAYSQIRRDGVEEVMETDEVSYQEVRPYIILIWRSVYDLLPSTMFQATTDSIGGASVTSDLTFEAGPPGKIEVSPKPDFYQLVNLDLVETHLCTYSGGVLC